jgi:hypothetical protein
LQSILANAVLGKIICAPRRMIVSRRWTSRLAVLCLLTLIHVLRGDQL